MRYRYIFTGGVKAEDSISRFRLLDKQKMQGESSAIRVELPDDAILEKWNCDEYSTWDSSNKKDYTLNKLNPKICIKINGRWSVLEDATNEWLCGKEMEHSIRDSIKGKYYEIPVYNIGFLTFEQYHWYRDKNNIKYSWRFDRLPADLSNIKIPPLTPSQLETLDFVREKFHEHYEEVIDKSPFYDEDEKKEAKEFFKDFIENISNDNLAYEWHRYSITGLDPCKKFETKEMVDKLRKSSYSFVHNDHYKIAVIEMINNMSMKFNVYQLRKEKETDDFEK